MIPDRIVFILSTGRTGTKSLAEGLAGEQIVSLHQPPFSRLLTIASNYYLHGWLPESALRWLVKRIRATQILQSDCRCYIQAFSLDHLPAKIISEQIPGVHIVHIVRDPRTFVPSYLNWMHTRFKSFIANKFIIGWQPSGYFTGEFSWNEWHKMDEFERVCWLWVYKNRMLEKIFHNTDNYLQIYFEDLFLSKNKQTFDNLLSFIGVPNQVNLTHIFQHVKNRSKKTYIPPWEEWPSERQKRLSDICGEQMIHYGYIATDGVT